MRPFREILPAGPGPQQQSANKDGSDTTPQSSSSSSRKHPNTKIACTPCRRRKSKCDGRRPACTSCTSSIHECEYDGDPDLTRAAALRKKHVELHHRIQLFEEVFKLLSEKSATESIEILRRMRQTSLETDLEELVTFLNHGSLLVQLSMARGALQQDDEVSPVPTALQLLASDGITNIMASM
jgi:Zn(2)-Cys(6) binuclear cluster domain-containing protein